MKQDNPFAKLGALDQKLYTETTPPVRSDTKSSNSGNSETQNTSKQESQKTRTLDTQKSREPESQNSGIPETLKPAKRVFYTKGSYRLCDEALDALGSAKAILRRKYKLKVNLEEIVETAVLQAYRDLEENKEKSSLVVTYSRIPENQNT